MKIEKISDTQIRCTLSREDLASRNLKISELAYATDKAKNLFHDMLEQANKEFGFEVEDKPLMIEAIPMMPDSIMLIVTKVTNPEDLDSSFARFTSETKEEKDFLSDVPGADSILDLFQSLMGCHADEEEDEDEEDKEEDVYPGADLFSAPDREDTKVSEEKRDTSKSGTVKVNPSADTVTQVSGEKEDRKMEKTGKDRENPKKMPNLIRFFEFYKMDTVIRAAGIMKNATLGRNALYKMDNDDMYQLILHQDDTTPEDFNRYCNLLSEYARSESFPKAGEAFLLEHARCIIPDKALEKLSALA